MATPFIMRKDGSSFLFDVVECTPCILLSRKVSQIPLFFYLWDSSFLQECALLFIRIWEEKMWERSWFFPQYLLFINNYKISLIIWVRQYINP